MPVDRDWKSDGLRGLVVVFESFRQLTDDERSRRRSSLYGKNTDQTISGSRIFGNRQFQLPFGGLCFGGNSAALDPDAAPAGHVLTVKMHVDGRTALTAGGEQVTDLRSGLSERAD